jgi:hypothetical protein
MFMDIREDFGKFNHDQVTTPKVITIGILPRMMMMRERRLVRF